MDKIKAWFKTYFKSFTFKRIGIILGVAILAYGLMTLGDYLEENNHYGIWYDLCTFGGIALPSIIYLIYEIVIVVKNKKISLAELIATLTISMIWFNVIGIIISSLVSDNNWIIKQDSSKFLNGLEYMITLLFNDVGIVIVTVGVVIVTLLVRLIKKVRNGKR